MLAAGAVWTPLAGCLAVTEDSGPSTVALGVPCAHPHDKSFQVCVARIERLTAEYWRAQLRAVYQFAANKPVLPSQSGRSPAAIRVATASNEDSLLATSCMPLLAEVLPLLLDAACRRPSVVPVPRPAEVESRRHSVSDLPALCTEQATHALDT
jgi:hypothetical protein